MIVSLEKDSRVIYQAIYYEGKALKSDHEKLRLIGRNKELENEIKCFAP